MQNPLYLQGPDFIKECQLSLFNQQLMFPMFCWIPKQELQNNQEKTSQFTQLLSVISFQGELETCFQSKINYNVVQQKIFAPGNESLQIFANIFHKQKMNDTQARMFNNLNECNSETDNVYEQFASTKFYPPQEYVLPNVASHIYQKSRECDLTYSLTFVVDLQKIKNQTKSFHFFSNYTKNLAQKVCKFLYVENIQKIRKIITSDLFILSQIIKNMDYSYNMINNNILQTNSQIQDIQREKRLYEYYQLRLQETQQLQLTKVEKNDVEDIINMMQDESVEDQLYEKDSEQIESGASNLQLSFNEQTFQSLDIGISGSELAVRTSTSQTTEVEPQTLDQTKLDKEFRKQLIEGSKGQQYIKRIFENAVAKYKIEQFSKQQIENAVNNITNYEMLQKICKMFAENNYQTIIIGPKKIANLLGRTLCLLLPSDNTGSILFARDPIAQDECTCSNEDYFSNLFIPLSAHDREECIEFKKQKSQSVSDSQGSQNSMFISTSSIESSQTDNDMQFSSGKMISSLDIKRNQKRDPFLIPYNQCSVCHKYQHTQPLVPGINIQCINADENTYHVLDFIISNDNNSFIINLCSSENVLINLNKTQHYHKFKQQIYFMCLMNQRRRIKTAVQQYLIDLEQYNGIIKYDHKITNNMIFQAGIIHHNTVIKLEILSYLLTELCVISFKETFQSFYQDYIKHKISSDYIQSQFDQQKQGDIISYFFLMQMKSVFNLKENKLQYIKNYYDFEYTKIQEIMDNIDQHSSYVIRCDTVDKFISSDMQCIACMPQYEEQYIRNWQQIIQKKGIELSKKIQKTIKILELSDNKKQKDEEPLFTLIQLLQYYDKKAYDVIMKALQDIKWG